MRSSKKRLSDGSLDLYDGCILVRIQLARFGGAPHALNHQDSLIYLEEETCILISSQIACEAINSQRPLFVLLLEENGIPGLALVALLSLMTSLAQAQLITLLHEFLHLFWRLLYAVHRPEVIRLALNLDGIIIIDLPPSHELLLSQEVRRLVREIVLDFLPQ